MHAPEITSHLAFVAAGRHGLPSSYQDPVRRRMGSERGVTCLKTDSEFGSSRLLGSQHRAIHARLRSEHGESWDSGQCAQALIVNIERVFPTRLLVKVGNSNNDDDGKLRGIPTALLGNGK